MQNNRLISSLIAVSLLAGCSGQSPEAQANELKEKNARIELAKNLQEQVTNNMAQILCGKYAGRFHLPSHIIIAPDGVYKLNIRDGEEPDAEKIANASNIYQNSKDTLVAQKIIRSQECGLDF